MATIAILTAGGEKTFGQMFVGNRHALRVGKQKPRHPELETFGKCTCGKRFAVDFGGIAGHAFRKHVLKQIIAVRIRRHFNF